MSFQARSPADVYRYALRTDGARRSLTDGFGFSIVLVNDESPVCSTFLFQYFEKLSHRTSNRVRFIFFGELTPAEEVVRRTSERFIPKLLRRMFLPEKEREADWQDLQPEALKLIDVKAERLPSWTGTCAIPESAGASIRFAERLGVGQWVPCLLIFTDVGDLHVHLLPLQDLDADAAFEHVRSWVDGFYRENHEALRHWEEAEERILALSTQAKLKLQEVQRWRDANTENAKALREIATAIPECAALKDTEPENWRAHIRQMRQAAATQALREGLAEFETSMARIAALEQVRDWIEHATQLLESETIEPVLEALGEIADSGELSPDLEASVKGSTQETRRRIHELSSNDPQAQLSLWRGRAPRLPSFGDYEAWTRAWQESRAGQTASDDYSLLIQHTRQLSVAVDPTSGSREVLEKLADRFGTRDSSNWWVSAAPVQEAVRSYLEQVALNLPEWLRTSPEVSITEALPYNSRQDLKPALAEAIGRERARQVAATSAERKQMLTRAIANLSDAIAAVTAVPLRYEVGPEHWRSALDRGITSLQQSRDMIRRELDGSLRLAASGRPVTNNEELRRLEESLDLYDRAIASLHYPHRDDSAVICVPMESSLSQATGVAPNPAGTQSQQTRAILHEAALKEKESVDAFHTGVAAAERARADDSGQEILIEKPEFDVFLSYRRAQLPEVELIATTLQQRGLKPWFDQWEILPGIEFKPAIHKALSRCAAFAIFIGAEGIRGWQRHEVDAAYESAKCGVPLIPVLLGRGAEETRLPPSLKSRSSVKIADANDEAGIHRLVLGIRALRPVPPLIMS